MKKVFRSGDVRVLLHEALESATPVSFKNRSTRGLCSRHWLAFHCLNIFFSNPDAHPHFTDFVQSTENLIHLRNAVHTCLTYHGSMKNVKLDKPKKKKITIKKKSKPASAADAKEAKDVVMRDAEAEEDEEEYAGDPNDDEDAIVPQHVIEVLERRRLALISLLDLGKGR